MSYDIMIIDRHTRFKNSKEFLEWYDDAVQWNEGFDYNDPEHATQRLKDWFMKMKDFVPPLNGRYAPNANELGNGKYQEADYTIARDSIYVALPYSDADEVKAIAFKLAKENHLSFFDISGTGELHTFDGYHFQVSRQQAVCDELNERSKKVFNHRNIVTMFVVLSLMLLLLVCLMFCDSWGMLASIPVIIALVAFGVWSNKWLQRSNIDVLNDYRRQQQIAESEESVEMEEPLLADVAWNFQTGKFKTQADFQIAVIKYNNEVNGQPIDKLLKEKMDCIGAETDFILFDEDSEEAEQLNQPKVHFKADDGHSFTGFEILFKLNNELYPLLQDSDTVFFEGICCYQLFNRPTVCRVLLGS